MRMFGAVGCVTFLMATTLSFGSQAVNPDPDPGIAGEGFVDYLGNYGEVFKLAGGWRIDASMHDVVEVVNHYPPFRVDLRDSVEPFNPKPSDFVPENFTRYALMQLVIMPRSVAPTKSLEELKKLKIRDLASSGVGFEVVDHPFFGGFSGDWPRGTFEIWVSTPYRLSQLYTASESYLCILTSGRDTPPSTVISDHYDWMRSGLRNWMVHSASESELLRPKYLTSQQIRARGISLRIFSKPGVWVSWILINGLTCLLAGLLASRGRFDWLRRTSLSLLIFSNFGALLGGIIGLLLWPIPWPAQHLPIASAVACLFMPLMAFLMGRISGIRPRRLASIGVTAWTLIAAGFLCYLSIMAAWGPDFTPVVPGNTALAAFVVFGIGGILFGLLDIPPEIDGGRVLGMFACFLILASRVGAQPNIDAGRQTARNSLDGSVDSQARVSLAARNISVDTLREKAKSNLSYAQVLYVFQRVEIKGVVAKDNTNAVLPGMFDKQITPAHARDKLLEVPAWIQDINDLQQDARQELSATAKRTAEELGDKEINEIVAHSWGTEIIYNLILTGAVKSPRRLIVAGMPDRDFKKWEALAKYTGTEVVVYTNARDIAAGAARELGGINESAAASELSPQGQGPLNGEDILHNSRGDAKAIEEQWEEACRIRVCNKHRRPLQDVDFHNDYLSLSHARLDYYNAMIKEKVLPKKGDAWGLKKQQDALVNAEAGRLFESELAKERESVVQQIEKQKEIARNASDRRLAYALRDIAAKACLNPDNVAVGEVENLMHPYDPEFYAHAAPGGLDGGCALSLYISLVSSKPGEQNRGTIREFVHSYFRGPPAARAPAPILAPPPLPVAPAPLPMRDPHDQVRAYRDLAVKACQNPANIAQADFDRLGGVPPPGPIPGATAMAGSLTGCPRYVFDRMIGANQASERLTGAMLTQWVGEALPRPPVYRAPPIDPDKDHSRVDPCRRFYGDYCNG